MRPPPTLQGGKRAARLVGKKALPSICCTASSRLGSLEAEQDRAHGISTVHLCWVTPDQAVTPGTEGWGQAVSVRARAAVPKPVITFTLLSGGSL